MYTLRVQQNRIEQANYRLKERDKRLFGSCIRSLKGNNKERAAVWANEIAEVRKIISLLYSVQLAIERVILRLETIKELSDVVVNLRPAIGLLKDVSQELFQVLPDVSAELTNVNDTIRETLYATKVTADESLIPVGNKTEGGEEILKEVSSFLERELSKTLPEPPTPSEFSEEATKVRELVTLSTSCSQAMGGEAGDGITEDSSKTLFSFKKSEIKEFSLKVEKPSLEDMLLEYVKKSNGKLDMLRCSNDLKTSNEEVEQALESLGNKGRIKIELKSPE